MPAAPARAVRGGSSARCAGRRTRGRHRDDVQPRRKPLLAHRAPNKTAAAKHDQRRRARSLLLRACLRCRRATAALRVAAAEGPHGAGGAAVTGGGARVSGVALHRPGSGPSTGRGGAWTRWRAHATSYPPGPERARWLPLRGFLDRPQHRRHGSATGWRGRTDHHKWWAGRNPKAQAPPCVASRGFRAPPRRSAAWCGRGAHHPSTRHWPAARSSRLARSLDYTAGRPVRYKHQ